MARLMPLRNVSAPAIMSFGSGPRPAAAVEAPPCRRTPGCAAAPAYRRRASGASVVGARRRTQPRSSRARRSSRHASVPRSAATFSRSARIAAQIVELRFRRVDVLPVDRRGSTSTRSSRSATSGNRFRHTRGRVAARLALDQVRRRSRRRPGPSARRRSPSASAARRSRAPVRRSTAPACARAGSRMIHGMCSTSSYRNIPCSCSPCSPRLSP